MIASDIQTYFQDKTILVTGATGFVGKLLVEKILRTCDVKKMFITIRKKKNKSVSERLNEYFDSNVYDRLKEERGCMAKKVQVVACDLSMPNLGISDLDRQVLVQEVNVVFHTAATVRFDEPLRIATNTNVRGTQEVLKLCLDIKNLSSVVYVSTAYSHCVDPELREIFYSSPLKVQELLTVVDMFNDSTLDAITPTILGSWPNTYVFSKSIAEDCVKKIGVDLPLSIVRPSIIIGTAQEPVPGWVDNYIGATGVFVGTILGVIRTLHCKFNNVSDLVPADYVVNCLIAAATKTNTRRNSDFKDIQIYNCTTSYQNPITWKNCFKYGTRHAQSMPPRLQIWHVFLIPCGNRHFYLFFHCLLHILPAYILDFFALCLGRKRRLVKEYRKISKFLDIIAFFATREWVFYNTNTQDLWKNLSERDRALYNFDIGGLHWNSYFNAFVQGGRTYLLKDPMDTIPEGHANRFKLKIAHYTLMMFVVLVLLQVLVCILR